MAEVHIVDIDGEQWNIKDLPLTARVATLEEKVSSLDTYSFDEIDTGKKWVDGSRIYRKVFILSRTSFNTDYVVIANESWISAIKYITTATIIIRQVNLPGGRYYKEGSILYFNLGQVIEYTPGEAYGVIEYTKIND